LSRSRGIIFDLDGTLVDSLDDLTDALNAALSTVGGSHVDRKDVRGWVGDGLPALCRRAWRDAGDEEHQEFVSTAAEQYRTRCVAKTRPYGNILKMLDLLQARGAPMAVLSNKPHELTRRVVCELGMEKYFVDIRGYVTEAEKKPSPQAALAIADTFGVAPAKVMLVGDSIVDIQTARNAGMIAVSVTWGFQEKIFLKSAGPDHFLGDPLEIISLLE
jgi:phosphoglycolate phosphatase